MNRFVSTLISYFTMIAVLLAPAFAWAAEVQLNASGHVYTQSNVSSTAVNCELSQSGNTLTIRGGNHQSLSATNPCKIGVKSPTAGRMDVIEFTSNVVVTFGSNSDTDGNLFGISAANWSDYMPMFIGVIYDGTSAYFTLSRHNFTKTYSDVELLCQKGDTDCDDEDVMILTTGLTLSNWASKPITQVAWVRTTYNNSSSSWSLSLNSETGFNFNYENTYFHFPKGQRGAVVGSHMSAGGGDTLPSFIDDYYPYYIDRRGVCTITFYFGGDNGTDGSGTTSLQLKYPYDLQQGSAQQMVSGFFTVEAPGLYKHGIVAGVQSDYANLEFENADNTLDTLTPADFPNGQRILRGFFSYRIFDNGL